MMLTSAPSRSAARSGSQPRPHTTLMTFHPAPRKTLSSSWMILPLPRTGPSSRCRLQLMTKIRLSSFSRPAIEIAPSDSGSSHSPSPRNAHTLRLLAFARLEEARLVDRHQRPKAHRHRRELPEIRHQPRVRIRRDTVALAFLPVVQQLLLRQASLDECPRVDARRNVTLHVDQVAAVVRRRRVPEMVEADVVEQRRRLEARDVAAEFGRALVRAEDDRHGVPADRRTDLVLELAVPLRLLFVLGPYRVHVRRRCRERRQDTRAPRLVAQLRQEELHPLGALVLHNAAQRVH